MCADIQQTCTSVLGSIRLSMAADSFGVLVDDAEALGVGIASEISIKLGAMWKQIPWSVVGFFGEFFGYSAAVVHRFMRKVMDEYDSILDKDTVHRVGRKYLDSSGEYRGAFELKVSTGLPLAKFPREFLTVRGHASALVANRRNEGDHRSMHLNLRLTPNVSPALLMARLRWNQTEDLLKLSSFVSFAGKL